MLACFRNATINYIAPITLSSPQRLICVHPFTDPLLHSLRPIPCYTPSLNPLAATPLLHPLTNSPACYTLSPIPCYTPSPIPCYTPSPIPWLLHPLTHPLLHPLTHPLLHPLTHPLAATPPHPPSSCYSPATPPGCYCYTPSITHLPLPT